ncbi:hypothetical protein KUTeg_013213 [Tegillarca granosa]|uniref:Uncharacterized protein n=1 Tax=Tegillarca granosa TaxID=220873 RepID=A0ABQ9ETF0_TEGGR|nr:hypothetical protein KUTeg_013213 [Tegillarca granosa]
MNDPEVNIMFSVPGKHLIGEVATRVHISPDFNRKKIPREEDYIESTWVQRTNENPKLYNGSKFRVDSVLYNGNTLELNIGLTCYRDFLGTNWSSNASSLQKLGEKNHNNTQAYMSDAMGVGAFVKTSDNKELVGKIKYEDINFESMPPDAVVHEIFDSIVREVVDEVNIPRSKLSEPEMLGIARNLTSAGRPSIEFLIKCSLNSREVLDLYHQGTHAEVEESTSIRVVSVDDVMRFTVEDEFWKNMAPSSKGLKETRPVMLLTIYL